MKALTARVLQVVAYGFVAACLTAGASAQPPGPSGATRIPPTETMRALNLSAEQKSRLRDLGEESRVRTKNLGDAMWKARQELEGIYSQPKLDARRARQLNDKINELQKDMLDEHLRVEQKLRSILTPDQFTRLRAGMAQHWKNRFPRNRTRPAEPARP